MGVLVGTMPPVPYFIMRFRQVRKALRSPSFSYVFAASLNIWLRWPGELSSCCGRWRQAMSKAVACSRSQLFGSISSSSSVQDRIQHSYNTANLAQTLPDFLQINWALLSVFYFIFCTTSQKISSQHPPCSEACALLTYLLRRLRSNICCVLVGAAPAINRAVALCRNTLGRAAVICCDSFLRLVRSCWKAPSSACDMTPVVEDTFIISLLLLPEVCTCTE